MQSIDEVIHRLPTDISTDTKTSYISTDTNSLNNKSKKYDNDFLFEDLSDLVNESFKGWYMKQFYRLGKDRILQLASIARADGKNPQRYFSYLIKGE